MTKIAFPTDEHFPYQDEEARHIALLVVEAFKPDELITGSDGLDFYALSKFDKDPMRIKGSGLQVEFDLWIASQKEWTSAAPKARKRYLPGNHEKRYEKYLWANPELADLDVLKLSSVLHFDVCGIAGEPEEEIVYFDRLAIRHGAIIRQKSGYSAMGELEKDKFQISTITGHTHRGSHIFATSRGNIVQAAEGFCLCKLDAPYGRNFDWQHGIVLATVTRTSLSIELVPFQRVNGKTVARWRGKEYR